MGVRLRTRGSIGAQLSGGLDSAAVAATAARLLGAEGRELTCFTAVPRPDFHSVASSTHFGNEGPAAAEVAALYPNIRHVMVESSATSFLDILDHNNNLYDHPCFGPSNEVWSNAIMAQAREQGITLLLNGQCGNSTLSYEGIPALSAWFRSGDVGNTGPGCMANPQCTERIDALDTAPRGVAVAAVLVAPHDRSIHARVLA